MQAPLFAFVTDVGHKVIRSSDNAAASWRPVVTVSVCEVCCVVKDVGENDREFGSVGPATITPEGLGFVFVTVTGEVT
jgi:hypothetical protein